MLAGGTHVSGQGKAQQMTHRPWHTIFEEALVKEQETNNSSGLKKKGAKTRTKGGNSGRQVTGGVLKPCGGYLLLSSGMSSVCDR